MNKPRVIPGFFGFAVMHAGLLIFLWLISVAAFQSLDGVALFAAVFVCASVALCFAGGQSLRLLKRLRYLFTAIFILFAFFTPGQALLVDYPSLGPSIEGIVFAAEHIGRILTVVFCVALLIHRLPVKRMIGGIYSLLKPFGLLGVPTGRIAVRILLTLRYVESDFSSDWRHWLRETDDDPPETVKVVQERFSAIDWVMVTASVLLPLVWFIGRQGL